MQISSSQSKAIRHFTGPAMVLAGPGSGKTTVITHRVEHLLHVHRIAPDEILVITFTRAAAKEMRERFHALSGGRIGVTFGTFHAVFFQMLKQAYHYQAGDILKEEERFALLSGLIRQHDIAGGDFKELVSALSGEISLVKNEQISLEHFYSGVCSAEVFRSIYGEYQTRLRSSRKLDYDDILVYAWQLLRERKDIRAIWQKRFSFILVDEFQDINLLQFETLKMLAAPENNLFVVGDDDQSIYRFRGAKPEIMLGFWQIYPTARRYLLEENFRSLPGIVDPSLQVIGENQSRFEKGFHAVRSPQGGSDKGEDAAFFKQLKTPLEESLYVVREIRNAHKRGIPYHEMAILTRTGAGGRYLAEQLLQFEIPVEQAGVIPCLYDHWIAADILTYLRLGLGSRSREDFARVMNRPLRYLSRGCLDEAEFSFSRLRMWYEDKPWMVERLDQMEEDLDRLGRMSPYAAVNYIRFGIGYDDYLKEYAKLHRLEEESLLEVAGEVQEQARGFETFRSWSDHMAAVLEEQKEQARRRRDQGGRLKGKEASGAREDGGVQIMTLHGAKGLEFDTVFLPDVNEKNLPYHGAGALADLEEERRLLYVGMTRAKNHLHVLWTKERFGKAQTPSRFLSPLLQAPL